MHISLRCRKSWDVFKKVFCNSEPDGFSRGGNTPEIFQVPKLGNRAGRFQLFSGTRSNAGKLTWNPKFPEI